MNWKIRIFVLLAAFQIACAETPDQPNIGVNKNPVNKTPVKESTLEPAIDKIPTEISESDKIAIYTDLVETLFYGSQKDLPNLGLKPSELLIYRDKTISPTGLEQLKPNSEIPASLLENFKKANEQTEIKIILGDILAPIEWGKGDRSLEKFFQTARQKKTDTKAVLGLSNLGIDDNYTTALVYVEFYRPALGLQKFFLQIELEKTVRYQTKTADGVINSGNYSEIKSFRKLPVD